MPRKSAPKRPPTRSSSSTPAKSSAGRATPGRATAGRKPGKKTAARKRPETAGSEGNLLRLQRVLASAGYGSRRRCEELIVEGRVEVDGQPVTELGTQVDPQVSKIYVDGTLLKREKLAYFVVNKPPGVVTTNSDPQGRTRVIDLVQERQRLFPVGRLDRSSEGLILLTNDGELAQQLAHPKYGVRKTYRVTVAGKVDNEKLMQMKRGIYIAEGRVGVEGAKILRHRGQATELEILLREGKNREIRRILARLGHKVLTLQRVAIGPLRLGELPRGAYRPVSSDELRRLRDEIYIQSKRGAEGFTDEELESAEDFGGGSTADSTAAAAAEVRPSKRTGPSAGKPARGAAAAGGSGRPSHQAGSKKTASPKAFAKKAAPKKAATPLARGPIVVKPKRSERTKPLEESKTIGTVIGGEGDSGGEREQAERRPPRSAKPAAQKAAKGKRPPKKDRGERR